ncbi:hypothetical protein FE257_001939 [Aspergillus nanangensis]|uniref:Uncharacterized protein n=1 Tax=Aspergillus nanangensis TaxID=2582783 RepID=A0AAD4GNJ9_ASPNN|nr:hypothetical protein FE257_001939 [Aspergillus nanangensis]
MSHQPEKPWTEEEKYTLLTEILKKAGIPSSSLLKLIREFNITPGWADIPLPPGRSLNSCQRAFYNMCHHVQVPANPNLGPLPVPRLEAANPSAAPHDSNAIRKRPLFPADKPIIAPRAIQPRPATSIASYSSESGASALLSPGSESMAGRGEPPRKRGRPSKAESERRKAAAEARGEPYPLPRRSGSHRMKGQSTPTSPAAIDRMTVAAPLSQASNTRLLPNMTQPELRYAPPPPTPGRVMGLMGPSDEERGRELHGRELGPTSRELPRPAEMRQTLPSPQALQLGHRETITRMDSAERAFEHLPPERLTIMADNNNNRRSLLLPASRRPEEPQAPMPGISMRTSDEKRTE